MDVTVVVGTFGPPEWRDLAYSRAIPSVPEEVTTIHRHGTSLAQARNEGLALVRTPWVIFLDADDELGEAYCETLAAGSADLRVPSVSYVRNGRPRRPYVPNVAGHHHDCTAACMEAGNYAVIGSMANVELVRAVGGFREEPIYEDWSLWLRMVRAGATVETIPEATYIAHWRADSRNREPSMEVKNRVHHEIVAAVAA